MEPTIDNIKTYLQQCLKEQKILTPNFNANDIDYGDVSPDWTIEDLARYHAIHNLRRLTYSIKNIYTAWFICVVITNCTDNIVFQFHNMINYIGKSCDNTRMSIKQQVYNAIRRTNNQDICNNSSMTYIADEVLSMIEQAYKEKLAMRNTFCESCYCDGKLLTKSK